MAFHVVDVDEKVEDDREDRRDAETLAALRCLLAPGGRMLITVPAYQWMWSAHDVFLQHKRRDTARSLRKALADAGLRVVWVSWFNMWLLPLALLARWKDRCCRAGDHPARRFPPFVNRALFEIFLSERCLLDRFNLPAGVSLLAVVRRADGDT